MPILKAYLMPHPPLAVPEVGRGGELKITNTLDALNEAASEIAAIKPDTIIYITPHSTTYSDFFHISPNEKATGNLSRFGADKPVFEVFYDEELVAEISKIAMQTGIPAGTQGEQDPQLDHGVTVPMYHINKQYTNYKAIRISQSGRSVNDHFKMGQVLATAINNLNRKAIIIASGDLSHKLTNSGPYSFAPEGLIFDEEIMNFLKTWDVKAIHEMDSDIRTQAAECGYNSIVMLTGLLDNMNVIATPLSYEGPFGVGYGVVGFTPTLINEKENPYCGLARKVVEYYVKDRKAPPFTKQELSLLPEEMLTTQAGVFVTLYKNEELRGCIGTIAPTTECIAIEITQNAISSCSQDNRFNPVDESELPSLTYKVDVLEQPEDIDSPAQLDTKKYGVIVESGHKRGLLLPNLDGVDTVEMQLAIAKQKARITPTETVNLKRFKVTRHE